MPSLFWIETANALVIVSKRGLISKPDAESAWSDLCAVPVRTVTQDRTAITRVHQLATELGHPAYDCCYLTLAMDLNSQVVSADQKFLNVARSNSAYASYMVALAEIGGD